VIRLFFFSAFILSISIFVSGCKSGQLVEQKLYWATNKTKKINLENFSGHKFKVEKFQDQRKVEPMNKIGENSEDKPARIVTIDTQDLSGFVTDNVAEIIKRAGVEVVESGQKFTITGEIKTLFVEETGLYRASAIIKYIVKQGDKAVYSEVKTGQSKRFGRSYKFENYAEALSNAIEDSLLAFLNDSKLKAALK
jgi:hypothetical protein